VSLARFGGDEFTVLIENTTPEQAQRCAESIAAALHEPVPLDGGQFTLTAAIWIAVSGEGSDDPESVPRDADAATYAAKARGRAQRALFDRTMCKTLVACMTLERELRHAIHIRPSHDTPREDGLDRREEGEDWESPRRGTRGRLRQFVAS
jgi:predicted signal transduction protein with EAL and GGDEF domain